MRRVLKPGGRFTVAAFRRRGGKWAAPVYTLRRRFLGMDAFSAEDLESRCRLAGLNEVRCLHAKNAWLIISARKIEGL